MKCPNCGFENNPGVSRCGSCGIIFAPPAVESLNVEPVVNQGVPNNEPVVNQTPLSSGDAVETPVVVNQAVVPDVSNIEGAYQVPIQPIKVDQGPVSMPRTSFFTYFWGSIFHPVDTYLANKDSLDEPVTSIIYNGITAVILSFLSLICVLSLALVLFNAMLGTGSIADSFGMIIKDVFSFEGIKIAGTILFYLMGVGLVVTLVYWGLAKLLEGGVSFFKMLNIVVMSSIPVFVITCFAILIFDFLLSSVSFAEHLFLFLEVLGVVISIGSLVTLMYEESGVKGTKLAVMHFLAIVASYYTLELLTKVISLPLNYL